MSERQLPSTIDYSRMLPMSIPAIAKRHRYYANNGADFNFAGARQIRIQVDSPNCLLDTAHGYIGFEAFNQSGNALGLDTGGAHVFFERVAIEQGGRVLSECREAHRLHSAILGPCQLSSEGKATQGFTGFTRSYNSAVATSNVPQVNGQTADDYCLDNHNNNGTFAALTGHRFSMNVTSGLFNQDKLIPLPLIDQNQPITIVLDMAIPGDYGAWNVAVAPANGIVIRNISYIAQLIEVGRDVVDQFRGVQDAMGGQLVLSGQDWDYSTEVVTANSPGELNLRLPVRKRSIKSMFWVAQSNVYPAATTQSQAYNLSYCGSMNIINWGLKFGSVVFPSTRIRSWGNAGGPQPEFERGECIMELAKAFGTLGWQNPTGTLNTVTYGTQQAAGGQLGNGDNGVGLAVVCPLSDDPLMLCPFGVSTEAYARSITESGVDTETLSQESLLQLQIDPLAGPIFSGNEDKIVHMWVLYDQHYYINRDGLISFSN